MSVGISTTWWSRRPPIEYPLVKKAIDGGNDPAEVIRAWVAGAWICHCTDCNLPEPFCQGPSGVRCYDRS